MAARPLPAHAYTTLGRTGRRVSRVGFGGYRVADGIATHRAALERALAGGVTLVDTSTNYGDGESERLVGRVLRATGREDAAVVVTKAGYVQGSNQEEALRRIREGRPWSEMTEYAPDCWHCLSPDFLRDQLTASLARL
ncbi:MAG TPA: aldo/keto reductase, partial [Thermoanaerobaculia bacterium]|nr:aldo/keto reductase [Thermoanaerobaculia bacterium]